MRHIYSGGIETGTLPHQLKRYSEIQSNLTRQGSFKFWKMSSDGQSNEWSIQSFDFQVVGKGVPNQIVVGIHIEKYPI